MTGDGSIPAFDRLLPRSRELVRLLGVYRDELAPELLYRGLIKEEELELLLRIYRDGLSRKELAEELGIDPEACNKRVQRAKAHLLAALEKDGLL